MSKLVAGLDEVGWGSLAGPIVSAVAVLHEGNVAVDLPSGITDSKKLSAMRREAMFMALCTGVVEVGIGAVEPEEIDRLSPKYALQESYNRAIAELRMTPDVLLVDGKPGLNKVKSWKGKQHVIVKGDLSHKEISIASIIAKVVRDIVMTERAQRLKTSCGLDYNWAVNKGYGTPDHMEAIKQHGLLFGPGEFYQHRRSYCSKLLGKAKIYGTAP